MLFVVKLLGGKNIQLTLNFQTSGTTRDITEEKSMKHLEVNTKQIQEHLRTHYWITYWQPELPDESSNAKPWNNYLL